MPKVILDGESLTINTVVQVARAWQHPETVQIELAPAAVERVRAGRELVERLIAGREVVYGVTTGFGAFKDRVIATDQTAQLQRNLLMSHTVGVGPPLPEATVRAMMLVRANALAKGYSGIRLETLQALLDLLNRGVHPVVPAQGSVGASGDLAPLAHMAVVLIGLGEAIYRGERLSAAEALERSGLKPIALEAKEGVALLNGTSLMTAIGCLACDRAWRLLQTADVAAAMSLEALHGTLRAFDARLHALRPHPGQVACAAHMRALLEGSEFVRADDETNVQDAYTLRCVPQVHGAVRDVVAHVQSVLAIELNAATDNPLLFREGETAIALSGGNFHGEPVALAMDYLGLALTDLGNMSERRIARLLDPASNGGVLPPFLTEQGGLNSGFMMLQYTAAALASENKVLAHPASADSIPTSANAEDHVSMGVTAARKAELIVEHVETIIALELLCAAQGIDFRRRKQPVLRLGRGTEAAYRAIRARVPFIATDEVMYPHIESIKQLVYEGWIATVAEQASQGSTP
ncbi:MAG: histidine ammonia-lyase [Chloroflexi bacterium]|nr:histidine ammonia-lyase [Chloroflexota bacterium]